MKQTKILSLCLVAILAIGTFAGCSPKSLADAVDDKANSNAGQGSSGDTATPEKFELSKFLTDEGHLKDVEALELVELGQYSGIIVPKSELVVKEEEVKAQIDSLLQMGASFVTLQEGEIKSDSTLNIDYVGKVDGVAFEGGSTDGAGTDVTVGVTQYIDDFIQQLVGHKVGDKFDINVTFPTDYANAELAGKDAVFSITINSLQGEEVLPEFTDEYVEKMLGEQLGLKTVKEARDFITNDIKKYQQENYVWKTLLENVSVKEIPKSVTEFKINDILNGYNMSAQQYGMSLDDYFAANGTTRDDFLKTQEEAISGQAKTAIILMAIAEKEGFTVTDDEIKEFLGTEDFSAAENTYGKPYIKFMVLISKADKLIQDKAVVEA